MHNSPALVEIANARKALDMPHMTGEVLAQELRRLCPELSLILCTGYSPLIDAARAQALGIDAFLLKPLNLHELAQTIRQVFAQRQEQLC